jgi:LPXTG-motif cell wall-anchored protein
VAKRLAWIAFLGTLILIVGMPAAFAAPGQGKGRSAEKSSSTQKSGPTTKSESTKKSGPTHVHQPNAINNASRGMNRPGSAGQWKSNGHVPSANSAPQGYSPSDPDWTGNGGQDKPGQTGGFNNDRDGNNGCGNDTDREDDNNGWCGLKPKNTPPAGPPSTPPPPTPPSTPPTVSPTVTPPTVLGRGPVTRGETLPKTGADVADLFVAGSSLLVTGAAMRRKQKRAP